MIKVNDSEWVCLRCGHINRTEECENCHTCLSDNHNCKKYISKEQRELLFDDSLSEVILTEAILKEILDNESATAQWIIAMALDNREEKEKQVEMEFWKQRAMFGGNLMALFLKIVKLEGTENEAFYKKLRDVFINLNEKDYEEFQWLLSYKDVIEHDNADELSIVKWMIQDNCRMIKCLVGMKLMNKNRLVEAKKWFQMAEINVYENNAEEIKKINKKFQEMLK